MTEWTTEDVREIFARARSVLVGPSNRGYAEFDAWLAAHDAQVAARAHLEGHREGYQTARGDLLSGAFIGGPTYEALRDSYTGQRIALEAAIKALREAAEEADHEWVKYHTGWSSNPAHEPELAAPSWALKWLRARADRLARGGQP